MRTTRLVALAWVIPGMVGLHLLAGDAASAGDDKGKQIGLEIDKAWSGYESEENDLDLILISASGDRVTRKMHGKMREQGSGEQTLTTITWPADQKGTHLLTWNHRSKDNDQWLYLPSIQRVKRISSRGQSGSFMGSEFAYEDLVNVWWIEKYDYKFVRDQKVGKRDTWVVERYPRDKDSAYSKQIVWVDKEYLSALRIDFYDRKGKLLKTASFKAFKKYGDKWRADRVDMLNRQSGKKSSVIWKQRRMGKTFSDDDFDPSSLGN